MCSKIESLVCCQPKRDSKYICLCKTKHLLFILCLIINSIAVILTPTQCFVHWGSKCLHRTCPNMEGARPLNARLFCLCNWQFNGWLSLLFNNICDGFLSFSCLFLAALLIYLLDSVRKMKKMLHVLSLSLQTTLYSILAWSSQLDGNKVRGFLTVL